MSLMRFSVRVPVLSVHKMFMLPKFSIADSRFTMTPFLDMAIAPLERLIVIIMGKSSGVSPTANATANSNAVTTPLVVGLRREIIKKTKITKRNVTCIIRKPKLLMPRSNSVSGAFSINFLAILPYSVALPVLTTKAVAVPLTTEVPMKQKLLHSVIELALLFKALAIFSTGKDSPVREDWLMNKSLAFMTLESAGAMSPAER